MKITTETGAGLDTLVIVEGDGRELRVVFDADGPRAAIWREGAPDGAGQVLELRSRPPLAPGRQRIARWSRDVVGASAELRMALKTCQK